MSRSRHIEQVEGEGRDETVRFIACGRSRGAIPDARAAALATYLDRRPDRSVRLWRATGRRRTVAAAAVCENPGRTGVLLHAQADAAGVKTDVLSEVCSAASADALERGMSLVQSLELPEAEDSACVLLEAGFWRLAELLYMRIATADIAEMPRDDLTWREYGQFDERELGRVIAATYEGSWDCPGLGGVREISDVIEGHKAGGVFTPPAWLIADRHGEAAGCVLVNDTSSPDVADLVYLGVAPAHRGASVGEALVRRAAADARGRGRRTLTLAVDASNTPAMRVYERVGFRAKERRVSYVMTG